MSKNINLFLAFTMLLATFSSTMSSVFGRTSSERIVIVNNGTLPQKPLNRTPSYVPIECSYDADIVKDKVQSFVSSNVPEEYKKAKRGLFTVDKNDLTVYVTFPQDEGVAYNKGREKIEWDFSWFSGYFVIGFGTNLVNSFDITSLDIAPLNNVEITRGAVYFATKYNGEWRACVIKTVN